MTIPLMSLLGFAIWTLLLLALTVGAYRWIQVLSGRASVRQWRADRPEGPDWYLRALRAHANCIENLPVFGTVVVVAHLSGVTTPTFNGLSLMVLFARVLHSLTHVALQQTEIISIVRFGFFFAQILGMLSMAAIIVNGL